jgi:hypothetical protein
LFIFIRFGDVRLGLNPKVQRENVEVKNEIRISLYLGVGALQLDSLQKPGTADTYFCLVLSMLQSQSLLAMFLIMRGKSDPTMAVEVPNKPNLLLYITSPSFDRGAAICLHCVTATQ